jgi:UPF0755 protein
MKKYYVPAILILLVVGVLFLYPRYRMIFGPSVRLEDKETYDFYISSTMDYSQVANQLLKEKVIVDPKGFDWISNRMNYPRSVRPGHYVLYDGMNNRELVSMLRAGRQTPIKYTFVKFRVPEDLAGHAAERLEFGKTDLMRVLNDRDFLKKYGLTPENVLAIFVPNTYELYWTVTPEQFVDRMYKEYRTFWNDSRNEKAKKHNLTRLEVMTLASIVEEETNKNDEKARIAGVYLNRIRNRWKLEADPTVKFALGNFELKRILNEHLEADSPYNTYMYPGIPPGPICTPSIPSIDAVLNEERHDFMFFCAKSDFSGYHAFARTLDEHNRNADLYQAALTEYLRKNRNNPAAN